MRAVVVNGSSTGKGGADCCKKDLFSVGVCLLFVRYRTKKKPYRSGGEDRRRTSDG